MSGATWHSYQGPDSVCCFQILEIGEIPCVAWPRPGPRRFPSIIHESQDSLVELAAYVKASMFSKRQEHS